MYTASCSTSRQTTAVINRAPQVLSAVANGVRPSEAVVNSNRPLR